MFGACGKAEPPPPPLLHLLLVGLFYHLATAQGMAPCYECDEFKEIHPNYSPAEQGRSHCSYPCECPTQTPVCPPSVSLIRDGCGCCAVCARQVEESCDGTALCDERRGLVCQYPSAQARQGACRVIKGLPCTVDNKTFDNGETFMLDCRTQCSCQNGTYACSSLCPQEAMSPDCNHPRLVDIPGQCCREWLCDSVAAERPPQCEHRTSAWSECSAGDCGLGASRRVSNINPRCLTQDEGRLCQIRPCDHDDTATRIEAGHRVRKGHECKATQKVHEPVRLQVGECVSRKLHWPKFCGECVAGCCTPQLSTTKKIEFLCPEEPGGGEWGLLRLAELETAAPQQLWHRKTKRRWPAPPFFINATSLKLSVQWILKCECGDTPCPEHLHRVHRTASLP